MKSIGNICSNNSLAVDRWCCHNLPVSSILTSILSNCMNVSARRNFSAAERRSKMSKVCYFNTAWLSHPDYRDWLERVSIHKARCHVCKKVVDISNMGESALKSHAKGTKHVRLMQQTAADSRSRITESFGSASTSAPAGIVMDICLWNKLLSVKRICRN